MEFLKNHFYKICFNIGGRIITFTCEVLKDSGDDDSFVEFKDKFDKVLTYNKNCIVSCEEVFND